MVGFYDPTDPIPKREMHETIIWSSYGLQALSVHGHHIRGVFHTTTHFPLADRKLPPLGCSTTRRRVAARKKIRYFARHPSSRLPQVLLPQPLAARERPVVQSRRFFSLLSTRLIRLFPACERPFDRPLRLPSTLAHPLQVEHRTRSRLTSLPPCSPKAYSRPNHPPPRTLLLPMTYFTLSFVFGLCSSFRCIP